MFEKTCLWGYKTSSDFFKYVELLKTKTTLYYLCLGRENDLYEQCSL